jgi:O-antigen/teichoic acid export membrane protein
LIPVCALGTVINGFSSMNLHLLNRQIQLRRLAEINLGVQILTIVLTISWALLWPTVWALVGAYVIANTGRLIASHTLCPGPRARFEWDSEAAWSMFRFGRWIFLSTVLGFVATRGDSFILGLVETSAFLGVYAIALFLNQGMVQALHTISSRVLFPIYSRLAETSPVRLQDQMFRMRAVIMAITVPAVCVVVVFGSDIVSIVYDDRYAEAGWMLELLSAGAVASIIGSTIGPALLAVGDSFRFMMLMAIRTVALLASMYYFWQQFGTVGLVFGVAIPDCITYPFLVVMVRKYGVWHHWLDLTGFLSAFVLIHLGWMVWN